jgi:hypothetical protein
VGFIEHSQQLAAGLMDQALDLMSSSNRPTHRLGSVIFDRSLRLFNLSSQKRSALLRPAQKLVDLAEQSYWLMARASPRVPEYPLFVPHRLGKSDANLSAGGPVLTDEQWFLIERLFHSLHSGQDATRKYRRRKPFPNVRRLLRGVLIKLAFRIRWRDLSALGFPARPCRELHRMLRKSGRMAAIYTHFRRHLGVYGESNVEALVARGHFLWQSNRIILAPGHRLTWRRFTALLLLQRAQFCQRKRVRKNNLDRRRRGAYLRFPWWRISSHTASRASRRSSLGHDAVRNFDAALDHLSRSATAPPPAFDSTPILEALFPRSAP